MPFNFDYFTSLLFINLLSSINIDEINANPRQIPNWYNPNVVGIENIPLSTGISVKE